MNTFVFTVDAQKKFQVLEISVQRRIFSKLRELKKRECLVSVMKRLHDFWPATHRLRVGNYRLILAQKSENEFLVLDVGHRRNVYG